MLLTAAATPFLLGRCQGHQTRGSHTPGECLLLSCSPDPSTLLLFFFLILEKFSFHNFSFFKAFA